jgi:hypothetical protein
VRFKARIVTELVFDSLSVDTVVAGLQKNGEIIKILGVVPAGQPWPGEEEASKPFTRPPRNTPPSGSPGTPTLGKEPVFTKAVAA